MAAWQSVSAQRVFDAGIAFALTLFCVASGAQTLPQEYTDLIRAETNIGPLDASLLGDKIDYYTGHVDFVSTDVSIPGNNALPVAVGRRYVVAANPSGVIPERAFGDWDIEVPHLEGVVATSVGWTVPGSAPDHRCSQFAPAPDAVVVTPSKLHKGTTVTTTIPFAQYSTGYRLSVPGYTRQELLQRSADNHEQPTQGSYPIVTSEWWMVSCLSSLDPESPGTGEGFKAIAPDGTIYTFNWLADRPYVPLSRPADSQEDLTATLDRSDTWMMATEVQDRFGNWVKYHYDPYAPLHLTQITSSDGRTINITYTGTTNIIQTISDGSYQYRYDYTDVGSYYSLHTVTLPDSSKWTISFTTLNGISWTYPNPWTCGNPGTPSTPYTYTGTITHPSGAQGQFTFTITRHGRYNPPGDCYSNSAGVVFASVQPSLYDSLSLTQKTISGPNFSGPMNWSLAYAGCDNGGCGSTVTTTVTDPRTHHTRYTFGTGYNNDEGLLTKRESGGSGSSYLQTDNFQYYPATGQAYPADLGVPTQSRGDDVRLTTIRPLQTRTTVQDGSTFTYTASGLDEFGFPDSISRSGSATKVETITRDNNKVAWILGSIQKIVSSGMTELDLTLNSLNMPTVVKRFGDLDQSIGYNTDGTIQSVSDGNSHQTGYSNWYRGIAKNISYSATGEYASVDVSNTGRITRWTDERGAVTTYDHDSGDRLSGIHYPAGDPGTGGKQTFDPTTIAWSTSTSGWTSTETTGTYQRTTTYDGFLRPVLTNEGGSRYVKRTYAADVGPSFISNPSTSPTAGDGTTYDYDGLGRVSTQNFVGYTTNFTYLSGSATRVDGPTASTTYHYRTYDEPSSAWPIEIDGPIYATYVARDTWGRPTSVSRGGTGGVTRVYSWAGRYVCAVYTPERGTTVYQRDGAGNVTASADIGSGELGCNFSLMNSSNEIDRMYDGRNRLLSVNYPNSTSLDISQTWWPNGLLHTANRGGINRTLNYNLRGLLTFETVDVDTASYEIDYAYNSRGQQSSLTYPDGFELDFAPNAFGQPTQIGSFATGLTYYPSGAVHAFTYGNGIAHSMTQEARLLPQNVVDTGVINATYSYDGAGNPSITDNTAGHLGTISTIYDQSNRLKEADATHLWGTAAFTYDDYDNLKTSTIAGTQTTFNLDTSRNRVSSATSGGNTQTVTYDGHGNVAQDGALVLTYDIADQLATARNGPVGVTGTTTWTNRFDALGLRIVADSATVGIEQDPPDHVVGIYSHDGKLLYEQLPNLQYAEAARYFYLGDHLLARQDAAGNFAPITTYVHTQPIGSLAAVTDATGAVLRTQFYMPYGGPFGTSQRGIGYAGQYDDRFGFVYMRARFLDPTLGRFLSADSVDPDPMTGGNFNRYAYADDNPLGKYDPSGREAACVSLGVDCFGNDPAQLARNQAFARSLTTVADWADREIFVPLGPWGLPEHVGAVAVASAFRSIGAADEAVDAARGADIFGNAQVTRRAGEETAHATTSMRLAESEATRPDAVSVHLNQTIGTITQGEIKSALRPDVATVTTDSTIDVIEVLSPGQDAESTANKYLDALGDRAGNIECVPPDDC